MHLSTTLQSALPSWEKVRLCRFALEAHLLGAADVSELGKTAHTSHCGRVRHMRLNKFQDQEAASASPAGYCY